MASASSRREWKIYNNIIEISSDKDFCNESFLLMLLNDQTDPVTLVIHAFMNPLPYKNHTKHRRY